VLLPTATKNYRLKISNLAMLPKQLNLHDVLQHAKVRSVAKHYLDRDATEYIVFDDGTVLSGRSAWSGTESDTFAETPDFLLYPSREHDDLPVAVKFNSVA
jgi:hypothetical protein